MLEDDRVHQCYEGGVIMADVIIVDDNGNVFIFDDVEVEKK